MDNRRLILLLVFSFSLVMLWDAWQRQASPPNVPAAANAVDNGKGLNGALPTPTTAAAGAAAVPVATSEATKSTTPNLRVVTDLFIAEISAKGGDLVRLELIGHPDTDDKSKGFVLFSETGKNVYLAQSGAIGEGLPNHKTAWLFSAPEQALKPGSDELAVRLTPAVKGSGDVVKTYIFRRNSYQIEVRYEGLPAGGYAYYQITRDGKPAESPGGGTSVSPESSEAARTRETSIRT